MIDDPKLRFGDLIFIQRLNTDLDLSGHSSMKDDNVNHEHDSSIRNDPNLYIHLEG
jgi:hypothetical protein